MIQIADLLEKNLDEIDPKQLSLFNKFCNENLGFTNNEIISNKDYDKFKEWRSKSF